MNRPALDADVCVLLTPREIGGHEVVLFGWLADAVRSGGLRPVIVAPTPALQQACASHGLARWLWPLATPACPARTTGDTGPRRALLHVLRAWRSRRPLLCAPGVIHVDAWLLAAAIVLRRRVWMYVPYSHTAVYMGYRAGWLRDRLLAPWVRRVDAWVTIDAQQARGLGTAWRVRAPVHVLPNVARVRGEAPSPPRPAGDGRLRVAYVGRFDLWGKGLDWLIGVLRGHAAWGERFHWRFQGRGPGEAALLELASALGPQRAVVCGHAPLDDALAVSDVLLLTSRYEGLPLVALEATVRGWPVVGSRGIGLDDLLPAASLFDFGDAGGLAQALDGLRTAAARSRAVAHARARYDAPGRSERYAAASQSLVQLLRRAGCAGRAC